jgi:hypothetical protein
MKYLEEKEGSIFFIPLFLPDNLKDGIKRVWNNVNDYYSQGRLLSKNVRRVQANSIKNLGGRIK